MPRKQNSYDNLIGQKYGRLTVLAFDRTENKRTFLKVRCDCGTETSSRLDGIKNGRILSCGCLRKEKTSGSKLAESLIGKTFGYLTVISFSHMGKDNFAYVNVRCKCGKLKKVCASSIKRKHTTSCGCYNKELVSRTGELSSRWGGGKTPKDKLARECVKYTNWRNKVFQRDNYLCTKCGKGGKLEAHHLRNFSSNPKLRYIVSNGKTFCKSCHHKFHKLYGKKNNTVRQFTSFLEND